MGLELKVIARIRSDFPTKFGIPRQSGIVPALKSTVVFEPEYRNEAALRGIEGYSHVWLIWGFSRNESRDWSPTVRPPRLGGNTRVGVFATRSPNRPNPIAMSAVKLDGAERGTAEGTVLHVSGADLMDGTPIYDIKPYVPYSDAIPDALGGFTADSGYKLLEVEFPQALLERVSPDKREALIGILKADPRPAYQHDPERIYGLDFGDWNIKFSVKENTLIVGEVNELCRKRGNK